MNDNPILIDIPMPIVTPRLILRPPQPGDGRQMHEAKTESFNHLVKWMPWAKADDSENDSEIMLRQAYARFIMREDMMLLGFHKETGDMVISTGLHRFDWKIRRFEIGYWTRAKYHNLGYASEAANALTRFAFGALGAKAVEICHAEGNEFSSRVPKKLGFLYEGCNRLATSLPDGRIVDKHVYARYDIADIPPLEITWG